MDKKLYILIRSDISPEQQAVQAGHAVATFALQYPRSDWKNNKLIYLQVRDHESIPFWMSTILQNSEKKPFMGVWRDPDFYDNQEVALFAYGEDVERVVRDLPLMRFK